MAALCFVPIVHHLIPILHLSDVCGPVVASSLAVLPFLHAVVGSRITCTCIDESDQPCDSVFPSLQSAPVPGILLDLLGAIGTMVQAEVGASVCLAASPLTTSSSPTHNLLSCVGLSIGVASRSTIVLLS